MGEFGLSQPVRQREDDRFLTGAGRFTDDIDLDGQARAVLVRSPHARAVITRIDTATAAASDGVAAVYTGADLEADNVGTLPTMATSMVDMKRDDGAPVYIPPHPMLAVNQVNHVGDPVAMVVAETLAEAHAAAELVEVEYESLPSVTDTAGALAPDAPRIYDKAPGNIAFDYEVGDAEAVDAAFAKADHVATIDLVNNRLIVASMEPRGAIGDYDARSGRYALYTPCQSVYRLRALFAKLLNIKEDRLHVISPDVGGSFGMKGFTYPEMGLVIWAAEKLRRPVKWASDRSEAFLSDVQGRDMVTHAELATDADGRFLALRARSTATVGAYFSNFGAMIVSAGASRLLPGAYTLPHLHASVRVTLTNKVWTDAYRGAGRPEASFVIERLADVAARDLGLSPAEIRRRNLVKPEQMPFTGATGYVIDSGDFAANLEDCLRLADADGFDARRAQSEAKGLLRGFGIATYIEATAGGVPEQSNIRFADDGRIEVLVGALSAGQGHETAWSQVVAEALGVPYDRIDVVQGDSDRLAQGGGTGGSRSSFSAGGALLDNAARIRDKAAKIAAHLMETAVNDIEFADGAFTVAGTDRVLDIMDIARAANDPAQLPEGMEPGLDEPGDYTAPAPTFPNGCHICEVEIDPDTGVLVIERYTVVDDFGRLLNPMIVEGQVHGGIVQGLGQALTEHCLYDPVSGQLLTGSFMDYAMPRADMFPMFGFAANEVLCKTNTIGAKGAGEAGTTGSPSALINAIVDGLSAYGISHIDMPATPERVWRAIHSANQ